MGFLDKAKKLAGREHTDTQPDAPAPEPGHPLAAAESATPPHGDPLAGAAIPEPGSDRTRPTAARRVPAPPPPPPGDGWGPPATPGVPRTAPPGEATAPVEGSAPPPAPPGVPAAEPSPPEEGERKPPAMPGSPSS